MKAVIDTSVALKWYVEENRRDLARRFLGTDVERFAPDLMLVELANVLSRKVRDGTATRDLATASLLEIQMGAVQLVPASSLLFRSLELSVLLRHALYDCMYLAAAEALGAILVTDDEKFERKCAASGFGTKVVTLMRFAS